jgi:hypothetical protein
MKKFVKIVNEIISWGIVAYLGIISLVFVLTIVGAIMPTAVTTFAKIPAVLFNFAFGVFFAILINYNVKVETPVKEKKVEEIAAKEEPKEEPVAVREEPITEEKVEEVEEKAEEPAVVSAEEPVAVAEEPVATESIAEEKPVKEKKAKKKVEKKEKKAEKKEKKEKKAKTPSNFEGGVVDVIGPANQTDKK